MSNETTEELDVLKLEIEVDINKMFDDMGLLHYCGTPIYLVQTADGFLIDFDIFDGGEKAKCSLEVEVFPNEENKAAWIARPGGKKFPFKATQVVSSPVVAVKRVADLP